MRRVDNQLEPHRAVERDRGSDINGWKRDLVEFHRYSGAATVQLDAVASDESIMIIAFHKPFGVLSQFTPDGSRHRTLAEFGFPAGVYPIGRLDAESEGLLLLSDEPELNARLLRPEAAHTRTYWAQVERIPDAAALQRLQAGIMLGRKRTLPCRAYLLEPQPQIPPRDPPIRFRKNVPDTWIGLELIEGKNHQVRRMTAAIGHPTLRLIRVQIGSYALGDLPAGEQRPLTITDRERLFEG